MQERRLYPRISPQADQRLLTVHGSRGHVCGRAEDESDRGLGVRVRRPEGISVGQTVLIHRMHELAIHMGTIKHIGPEDEDGVRLGIEIHAEERLPYVVRTVDG